MAKVTYVQPNQDRLTVEVDVGTSVMNAGMNAGVAGIIAECGGSLSCATCHIYVASSSGELPAVSAEEEELLEWTAAPRDNGSRLSCQLIIADDDDELVVRVPDQQV